MHKCTELVQAAMGFLFNKKKQSTTAMCKFARKLDELYLKDTTIAWSFGDQPVYPNKSHPSS